MFKHTKLCTGLALAFGAMAIAPSAIAQDSPKLQSVTVTGSSIPRADKETPSPIQVISNEELKASGYTTINEVLQNLTANGAGTLSKGFSGAFAGGASGISLRGLSLGATLILIDGHRMAPYPLGDDAQRAFVDISSIPFSAVERIEILKDGASAVYGSDAIAGVVNVILNKTVKGTQISAEVGQTEEGGGGTRHFNIAQGFGDDDSKVRGYVSFEARRGDAIKAADRKGHRWSDPDYRSDGGINTTPGAFNSNFGSSPSTILTPILQRPGTSANVATNLIFLNPTGCDTANFVRTEGVGNAEGSGGCPYENYWSTLQPRTENNNLLGRLNIRLGSDTDLRLTASRFESKTYIINSPLAVPNGSFAGVTATGPGIIPGVKNAIPVFRVPANYPGNTFGVPANVRGFLPVSDVANRENLTNSIATRFIAEVNTNAMGWDMEGSVSYSKVETNQTLNGLRNNVELLNALNDPNPLTRYNLLGGNSAAVIAKVQPTIQNQATQSLFFVDGKASRKLADLAGGPLALAVGFTYAAKDLNQPNPKESQDGSVSGAGSAYAVGTEKALGLFTELNALPIKELELVAAARYDRYDTYGNSFNPQVKFKYTPVKAFAIRGTASTGFRAPSAAEVGTAGSQFVFTSIRDPLLCSVGTTDANGKFTPTATSPLNVPANCNFTPTYLQSTTPTLEPEKSKSYTLGIILEPIANWSTTVDFYKVTIDGQIVPESSVPGLYDPLNNLVRGIQQNVTYGDGRTGPSTGPNGAAVGPIQYVTTGYVNGSSTSTSGVEFETSYKFNLSSAGSLKVGLQLSHVFNYTQTIGGQTYELAGTHGPSVVGSDTGNPRDRGQLQLTWETGPVTLSTTTNYVGTYDHTDPSLGQLTCDDGAHGNGSVYNSQPVPTKFCKVASFVYTNFAAKYKVSKAVTVRGTITNMFDNTAPVDVSTYGGTGQLTYNPALHQAGAIGRGFSVGVDLQF